MTETIKISENLRGIVAAPILNCLDAEQNKEFFDSYNGTVEVEFRVNGYELKFSQYMKLLEEAYLSDIKRYAADQLNESCSELTNHLRSVVTDFCENFESFIIGKIQEKFPDYRKEEW